MVSTQSSDDAKRAVALAAVDELPEQGIIGLGTGTTARFFIDALGELVRNGRRYIGVPTSEQSRRHARACGIPLLDDDGPWDIAMTVDGADEVDDALRLLKGGGGAHAREKIVNHSSRYNVILIEEHKRSRYLGEKQAVAVEVLEFGHLATRAHLARLGEPVLRAATRSDAGNLLYDLRTGPIRDPGAFDLALLVIPGVVATGLFVDRVDLVLVAGAAGVSALVPC